jgi:hypothetical protein
MMPCSHGKFYACKECEMDTFVSLFLDELNNIRELKIPSSTSVDNGQDFGNEKRIDQIILDTV